MLRMAEVRRNHSYSVIALAPSTPAAAEITAITNFRIISQTDFLIAIIQHLLSIPHYPLSPTILRCRIGRFLTTAARFVITRTSGVATASRSQCFRQLVDVDI